MLEDGEEVLAFGGESVSRMDGALLANNAVLLQVVEALGQGSWIEAGDGLFQLTEALGAAGQVAQDQGCPLVANDLHGAGDAAVPGFEARVCEGFHTFALQNIVDSL